MYKLCDKHFRLNQESEAKCQKHFRLLVLGFGVSRWLWKIGHWSLVPNVKTKDE